MVRICLNDDYTQVEEKTAALVTMEMPVRGLVQIKVKG